MSELFVNTFANLLNMSLTAGIIIVAVLVLRLCLHKAPKTFSYALWAVVLFRLLCPFSFQTNWSLLGVLQRPVVVEEQIAYVENSVVENIDTQVGLSAVPGTDENTQSVYLPEGEMQTAQLPPETGLKDKWLHAGAIVWGMGVVVILAYSIVNFTRFTGRLKGAVRQEDNIYCTPMIDTPFVCGIIRPRIYLPRTLEEHEKNYIVLHEKIHIKRGDHVTRVLAFLALTLHWFNPLVWVAFVLSAKDMEMSCDEAVIRKIGSGSKKEYSASLLNLATGKRIVSGIPLAFGEGDTGSRIKNVLRYKKPAMVITGVAIVVCIVAAVFLLGNPEKEDNTDKSDTIADDSSGNGTAEDDGWENTDVVDSPEEQKDTAEDESSGSISEEVIAAPLNEGSIAEGNAQGTFSVNIRTLAKEERLIDNYIASDTSSYDGGAPLVLAEDCIFKVNYEMAGISYEEVSYDTFAEIISQGSEYNNKPAMLTFEDNVVVEAVLKDGLSYYGITFSEKTASTGFEDFQSIAGENMLEEYYTLVSTESKDIADAEGIETIEVYTGNIGDGDSGFVIFYDAEGNVLYTEFAHMARAGWNNVYIGEVDGNTFIMTAVFEDRGNFGGFLYEVFRLSEDGDIRQIAGSSFSWDEFHEYNEELFTVWGENFDYYMENSYLVLSSQDGEVRTERVCEADKYNTETLREMCLNWE